MADPKILKLSTFLHHFDHDESPDRRFCFITGAGASKESGIRTGAELVKVWTEDIKKYYGDEDTDKWMQDNDIDPDNLAPHYSKIYDKRFELRPKDGFDFLEKEMEGAEPSCGYSVLVQVLTKTNHNVVITVNFDSMVEDAMFTYTNKEPLVCGHEALAGFIRPIINRPLIAKIHRDVLLAPKSSSEETACLSDGWAKALTDIFKIYTPVVIGYGGNDGSLMDFLEKVETIEGGIFWCHLEAGGLPAKNIIELVSEHKGRLVPIDGFDDMMVQLNDKLGYPLLGEKITEIAGRKAKRYREQIEDVWKKAGKSEETKKALKDTIKKTKPDWWTVKLAASSEPDIGKRDLIYQDGLKLFGNRPELQEYYALFLHFDRKDYDRAEEHYQKAMELNPDEAIYTFGYAIFLENARKDYDQAEKYYQESLKLDPKEAQILGRYASFLATIRKDYHTADEHFKRALELDSNDVDNIRQYALFLADRNQDPDLAEQYFRKALELNPESSDTTGAYATFLAKTRKNYELAEKYFKSSLELDPNNARAVGAYATFLSEIRKDYDHAEEYYRKALQLDPGIAVTVGAYATFLANVRKDHKSAEEYYKKALELDPTSANTVTKYGHFLSRIRKDYERAENYYKQALRLDPNDANINANYANFLAHVPKDYDQAKELYKKAIELDPTNANTIGNYAQLLIVTGRKPEAKKLIDRAFSLNPDNQGLLAELWCYRYANFYEEYGETAYDELVKLIKDGARSIGWEFSDNIELAKKEGHPHIDKLEKLSKIITEDAPISSLEEGNKK